LVTALAALAGRILLLGTERVLLKGLTAERDAVAAASLFFGLGAVTLLPLAIGQHLPGESALYVRPLAAILVYSLAFALYVGALRVGDATIVAPLYHGNGFFILLLAVVFLGEPLTILRVLGLALIVIGAGTLEARLGIPDPRALLARADARMMILSAALLAIGRVIDKGALDHFEPRLYAFLTNAGIALVLLLYLTARGRLAGLRLARERPLLTLAAGAVNGISYLLLLVALTTLDVSVAEPASGVSIVITAILARMFFGERLGWRLLGGLVLVAGAWLLFL
jgi:bacterial/archaeal transporter family protein